MDHILDHKEQAIARFVEQFRDKPNFVKLMSAVTTGAQSIEDALWDLYSLRWLDNATGYRLDIIGKLVGEKRSTTDDEVYRKRIKARVRVNLSSGTVNEILAVFSSLLGGLTGVSLIEYFPAGLDLVFGGAVPLDGTTATLYASFLKAARAAGVQANFQYQQGPDTETFMCAPIVGFCTVANNDVGVTTTIRLTSSAGFSPFGDDILIDLGGGKQQEGTYTGITGTDLTGAYFPDYDIEVGASVQPLNTDFNGCGFTGLPLGTYGGGNLAGVIGA